MDTKTKALYSAILSLKSMEETKKFLRDLLTEAEIKEFANRWQTAQMLYQKVPYYTIAEETGMSSTTIARISKWLNNGEGGYKLMLKKMKNDTKTNHHTTRQAV